VLTPFCDEHRAQFLGNLYVLLVHNFRLNKSYNTFSFAQVAPFKLKQYVFKLQISPTRSLSICIGVYGENEGGGHRQKLVKEHYAKWTNNKKGCFRSLVDQSFEVYLGGSFL
jgi:hypothetical protein